MASMAERKKKEHPNRAGKQSLTVWMSPEVIKIAKIGALLDDSTIEQFVERALRAEIEKRGMKL
ncbi:putative HicB family RNase H-like nuclease [Bosea sp. BE271]|uniref:hypothetical protein n=1 Tax=Bosea TaxID=85413 RepID=UPI0028543C94|nr:MULTISPECIES: hypothetical protein [Bosea]MDR6830923.1 putative HicB family RNase H-like nuclease [Bosea robiniae]MDR6897707.1 putative HicB family RNase H-like nuclease [Bosea sp. BE109]MDR7141104.1 putative HicB family RNase H-like nuclease [Bosea sp. BE168]MDR7177586.1 putative HicB family RNase H-like nuclease [Bosea sp. BE271]